jgi:hypothetical protein
LALWGRMALLRGIIAGNNAPRTESDGIDGVSESFRREEREPTGTCLKVQ